MIENPTIDLPLVSFVIPTFNRVQYLRQCLESVVNQSYKNLEVIVVNDNSTDDTEEILKEYRDKYKNFYYYNSDGIGGNAARNLGVKMAKGDYIAFHDDDDICELDRIHEQIKPILKSSHKANFVISGFSVMDNNNKIIRKVDYQKPMESIGFTGRWLVNKKLVIDSGGFDVEQFALQDVEFFWRAKANSDVRFVPKSLVKFRDTQNSVTKDSNRMIEAIDRLLKLHSAKMSTKEKNIWIAQLCVRYARQKKWTEFKSNFSRLTKIRLPFFSFLLYLTYIFKDSRILKIYSIIKSYFDKLSKLRRFILK